MRDINRIPEVLAELGKLWYKYPDWRFGQLISNVASDNKYSDIFFPEDNKWLEWFKNYK